MIGFRELHWLPVCFWVRFKVLVIPCKNFHGIGPGYLRDCLSSMVSAWLIWIDRVGIFWSFWLNNAIYQKPRSIPLICGVCPLEWAGRRRRRRSPPQSWEIKNGEMIPSPALLKGSQDLSVNLTSKKKRKEGMRRNSNGWIDGIITLVRFTQNRKQHNCFSSKTYKTKILKEG